MHKTYHAQLGNTELKQDSRCNDKCCTHGHKLQVWGENFVLRGTSCQPGNSCCAATCAGSALTRWHSTVSSTRHMLTTALAKSEQCPTSGGPIISPSTVAV
jgi:hypothetical protein